MTFRYYETRNSQLSPLNVHIKYLMVQCNVCGRTWGIAISPNMDTVDARKLTCMACATDTLLSKEAE